MSIIMASQFKQFVEQNLGIFPQFLIYAFLELVMIVLLFIDGFLAFISNEFAKYFDLEIPCLLCTRIDHVLVHRDSDFYYNESICEDHKKNISSLAYCHVHRKLSDIKSMCEGCLLSFAAEKDPPDIDTHKSLVGILHKDMDGGFVEDDHKIFLKGNDVVPASTSSLTNRCSCCGEPLKLRNSKKKSMNATILSNTPAPSPRVAWRNEEVRNLQLTHIRFNEFKLMSDIDSELQEDEIGIKADHPQVREDLKSATVRFLPESEDISEDASKTPSFIRGNKFFGIPLTDAASGPGTPRWANRLARKKQFEKEFFAESNDTNAANEAEGDIVQRLKKQVRLDRKSLIELYMELDEERSASAVAANNAMAMITRLQAEKASVQMEALQYQRMMDEQAEYDQEALQVMKDIIVKREDEIKVLEADLEAYKEKYGHLKKVGSDECEVDVDEDYQELKSQTYSSYGEKSECESPGEADYNRENEDSPEGIRENRGGTIDEASLDFEGEKSYLLGMLTNLEKKVQFSSEEGTGSNLDMVNKEDEDRGIDNKAVLKRELSLFRERLRAIEADSGFLKQAAMTLQKGGEGTKLLTQIAQHLEKLRHPEKTEDTDA